MKASFLHVIDPPPARFLGFSLLVNTVRGFHYDELI